jgi:hypothetical protein
MTSARSDGFYADNVWICPKIIRIPAFAPTIIGVLRPQIDALNAEWRARKTRDAIARKLGERGTEVSSRPAESMAGTGFDRRHLVCSGGIALIVIGHSASALWPGA